MNDVLCKVDDIPVLGLTDLTDRVTRTPVRLEFCRPDDRRIYAVTLHRNREITLSSFAGPTQSSNRLQTVCVTETVGTTLSSVVEPFLQNLLKHDERDSTSRNGY